MSTPLLEGKNIVKYKLNYFADILSHALLMLLKANTVTNGPRVFWVGGVLMV